MIDQSGARRFGWSDRARPCGAQLILTLTIYILIVVVLAVVTVFRPATALGASFCLYVLKQWGQVSSGFIAAHQTQPK